MKLDKFSLFGIIVALALIAFQMSYPAKNKSENPAAPASGNTTTAAPAAPSIADTPQLPENFTEEEFTLQTDSATFKFSSATGGVKRVEFPDQHEVNQLDVPVELNRYGTKSIGGLESVGGDILDAGYKMTTQTADSISFVGQLTNGLLVEKKWQFAPAEENGAEYRLELKLTVENPLENAIEANSLNLSVGGATPLYKGELPDQSGFYYLAEGGYKKIKSNPLKKSFFGSKLQSLEETKENVEFIGVGNQFFTEFVKPVEPYTARFIARTKEVQLPAEAGGGPKNEVSLALSLPREIIEGKNGREQFNYEVYAGPKRFQLLKQIKPNGGLVMNYGFFKPISGILNNILTFLHHSIFSKITSGGLTWGLSIIALTIVIRTIMWPLHNVSARSMKRMSKLQPKIQELKEKYPNDPQKVQTEQMKLFSEYGINPMGGCLPMLGQIPIFFGLFTMLKSAVEFRHESFLWIKDLSQPDTVFTIPVPFLENGLPLNILPLLMFITMAIQMSMNPAPTDPTQKAIMRLMPLMMVFFCYNFASALALYWTTSNIFTIFQTWLMKKLPEPELKKKKAGAGGAKPGGFMEKIQKQAEEMQRLKSEQQKSGGAPGGPMRDAKPKKKRGPKTGG